MTIQSLPEFLISQARLMTMPEITFFYVTNQPTAFANLDRDLDPLLASIYEAKAKANIAEAGPDITRYYISNPGAPEGEPPLYRMEVGIPVKPGMLPAGAAQVMRLPPYHCMGVMLWGSLAHVAQAYEALGQAVQQAGLERGTETREWNYWFEAPDSPNNIMGIYMEVKPG